MKKNVKTIRLTEAQLEAVIAEATTQILREGRFGDLAKRAGKGLAKGALAAGAAAATMWAADRGLENDYQYDERQNQQAAQMQHDAENEYNETHPNDTAAWNQVHQNESKMSDKVLESIIRQQLKKLL